MKRVLSLVLFLLSSPAWAGEELQMISWGNVRQAPWGEYGRVVPADDDGPERLVIENPHNEIRTIPILTIENPGIDDLRWALHGRIRYTDVKGKGYAEMWSHFPDGSQCYTRTLAATGPTKWLTGSSGWRNLALPFYGAKGIQPATKLTVNVYLPSYGTVEIGPLTLWEYTEQEDPQTPPGAWWGDNTVGWIGGLGGSTLGLSGALIGILCGIGRGRRLVLALHGILAGLGAIALVVGLAALWLGQPAGVWYPLVLGGGIGAAILGGLLPVSRRSYMQRELRKMQAMDV